MRASVRHLMMALCVAVSAPALAEHVTVLYKRDTDAAVPRLDVAAQAALQTLENRLIEGGHEVLQAPPEVYARLDAAKGVILTFAPDAGAFISLEVQRTNRQKPGDDAVTADVRIRARLHLGRRILAAEGGAGSVGYHAGSENAGFEAAARRAVDQLVPKLLDRLGALPPASDLPPPGVGVPDGGADESTGLLAASARRWGVIIGVSDFSRVRANGFGAADLPGVTVDVKAMQATMLRLGVEPARLRVLYNQQATGAAVRDTLRRISTESAPEDLVYVYISSHGFPKQGSLSRFGYPVTYDFDLRGGQAIDFEEFRQLLGGLQARHIIWVNDTCHSGLATEGLVTVEVGRRNLEIVPPSAFSADVASNIANKHVAVFAAATAEQYAMDLGKQGGLFSRIVVGSLNDVAGKGARPAAYDFFKRNLDGPVQDAYRAVCAQQRTKPDREACERSNQQPVFGAQGGGKRLQM